MPSLSELRQLYSGQDIIDAYNTQYEKELKRELIGAQSLHDWAKAQYGLAEQPMKFSSTAVEEASKKVPIDFDRLSGAIQRDRTNLLLNQLQRQTQGLQELSKDKSAIDSARATYESATEEQKRALEQTPVLPGAGMEGYRSYIKGGKAPPTMDMRSPQSVEEEIIEPQVEPSPQKISALELSRLPIYDLATRRGGVLDPQRHLEMAAQYPESELISPEEIALMKSGYAAEAQAMKGLAGLSLRGAESELKNTQELQSLLTKTLDSAAKLKGTAYEKRAENQLAVILQEMKNQAMLQAARLRAANKDKAAEEYLIKTDMQTYNAYVKAKLKQEGGLGVTLDEFTSIYSLLMTDRFKTQTLIDGARDTMTRARIRQWVDEGSVERLENFDYEKWAEVKRGAGKAPLAPAPKKTGATGTFRSAQESSDNELLAKMSQMLEATSKSKAARQAPAKKEK